MLGAEPRQSREGADREAVIAAHEERKLARTKARIDGVANIAAPSLDLGEVPVPVRARSFGIDRSRDVAAVAHLATEAAQGFVETGDAQRLGPHRRAAPPRADVGRRAD